MTAAPPLAFVRDLCRALDDEHVRYCHWKSNTFLGRSRSGDNDLDLLVHRADADRFGRVLHGLGCKTAFAAAKALPGVTDHYGFDEPSGRVVHVHAHHQLIVGDDLTKSYSIPLEAAYLASRVRDGELYVPEPELELIVLVIRLVVKYASWDAMLTRRGRPSASERAELADLESRTDAGQVEALLKQWLPFLDHETFRRGWRALAPTAGRWQQVRAAAALVPALEPCARRSRGADVGLKVARRGLGLVRRVLRRPGVRRRLVTGGSIVAIVGADGAGKTTALDELERWLGHSTAVERVHLGRPRASLTTRALTRAAQVRGAPRRLLRVVGATSALPRRPRQQAVLATALARDRYREWRRARRLAINGAVVLSDRFPLPVLTRMDSPRVEQLVAEGCDTRFTRWLAARERSYYARVTPADVLIVLRVDAEVAVARKPEEDAAFLRARWEEIWAVDWAAVPAHVVDAGAPAAQVLATLQSIIWSAI